MPTERECKEVTLQWVNTSQKKKDHQNEEKSLPGGGTGGQGKIEGGWEYNMSIQNKYMLEDLPKGKKSTPIRYGLIRGKKGPTKEGQGTTAESEKREAKREYSCSGFREMVLVRGG